MSDHIGFDIRQATRDDDPELRALVGSVSMPGAVSVRFAREPDYFLGASIMGDPCDVLVARQRLDGALAGIACRAEHSAFVNGHEMRVGYIGQIRIASDFRGRWLIQQGAQRLRELSPPGLWYLGVIARENPRARGALTGARLPAGWHAVRLCGLTTCAILLRPRRTPRSAGLEVQPASRETLPEVVAFLRQHGPRRQLFPAYTLEDFSGGTRLRGLAPQDVMVARRSGAIAGVMATWDQTAYKQDVVDAYGSTLQRLQPAYDLIARLFGAQPLTPPGQAMPLVFAACICIADDDPAAMRALLAACAQGAYLAGKAYLMLGLADNDPLLAVVRRWLHVTYRSDLYAGAASAEGLPILDGRVPYVEIATL